MAQYASFELVGRLKATEQILAAEMKCKSWKVAGDRPMTFLFGFSVAIFGWDICSRPTIEELHYVFSCLGHPLHSSTKNVHGVVVGVVYLLQS